MSSHWAANLQTLGRRSDEGSRRLASVLGAAGPAPDLGLKDRSGATLPAFLVPDRPRSLVSAYDSRKEAERWAQEITGGTVAVFGAAGVAAADALANHGAVLLFWVEPRLEVWRSLFTWEDWSGWLVREDWIPCCGDAEDWGRSLRDRYHPLWDGGFRTQEWRSSVQGFEGLWDRHRRETAVFLDGWASDASTQARFGERWYRNTLTNLKNLSPFAVPGCAGARVVIAGAGPGLEDALESPINQRWLEDRERSGDRLFSTDTALPALTARSVIPDLVLCLDGQLPSYHHFVPAHPPVPLIADLASLPLLGRVGMPVVRYLSGHPFGVVVRRHFAELPLLDGSLGNVSGLGLSVARALGARQVDAWGVDFAYRDGQSYARGTYVYDLTARRAERRSPWETRLSASCYGASGVERTYDGSGRALDTTPLLRDYKRRWDNAPSASSLVSLAHGGAGGRWDEFRSSWGLRLERLPFPPHGVTLSSFVRSLNADQRSDWWALWPLAFALHRQGTANLLQSTVDRALAFLQD